MLWARQLQVQTAVAPQPPTPNRDAKQEPENTTGHVSRQKSQIESLAELHGEAGTRRFAVGRRYNPAGGVQITEQSQKISDRGIYVAIVWIILCRARCFGVLFLQKNYLTRAKVFIPALGMTEALLKANDSVIFVLFEDFPRWTEEILGMAATKPGLFQIPGSSVSHQDVVLRRVMGNIGVNM